MPELAFPMPEAGAGAGAGLAAALAEEVSRQDAVGTLYPGAPPEPRRDRVNVVLQDDAGGWADASPEPSRTIVVLTAPPGTESFERGADLALRAGAPFHVNAAAVERLLELGVPARHLQLGYASGWDRFDPEAPPAVEVVRGNGGYFDWPAALAAIHGGSVVLHEHSRGMAPLVAGEHVFVADTAALDPLAAALLRDPARLDEVRREAIGFLRDSLPMARAAAALAGAARSLVGQPLAAAGEATPGQPASRSK